MKKTFRFVVATHEEFGELGFRPVWFPNGDPLGGMAVAHDMLEHFEHDDGTTIGELQAFGAAMFIRGDGGYWSSSGRIHTREEDNLGLELMQDVWRLHLERGHALPERGMVRHKEIAERARAVVAQGYRDAIRNEAMPESELPSKRQREIMARWLARGYMRAKRRYRGTVGGANSLAWLFRSIEEQADKRLRQHADEGMLLTVRVDTRSCNHRMTLDYPFDPYDDN